MVGLQGARAATSASRSTKPWPCAGNYNPPPGFNFEWGGWDQNNVIEVTSCAAPLPVTDPGSTPLLFAIPILLMHAGQ